MNGPTDRPPRVLFDSDVVIDAGRGDPLALACLHEASLHSARAVSAVTRMELIVGCRSRADLRVVERFLRRFEVIEINEQISPIATGLLRRYRRSHGLLTADALIAATALVDRIPLVTRNQRDFRFIAGLDLLPYPHPFGP